MKNFKEMNQMELVDLAAEAMLKRDLKTLMAIDAHLDTVLAEQEKEMQATHSENPEIAALADMLMGELGTKEEPDFIKTLQELSQSKSEPKKVKKSPKDSLDEAKKKALEKNPEMGIVMAIESMILADLQPKERVEYLIQKYEALKENMIEQLAEVDKEMGLGIAGAITTYDLVLEDLVKLI